MRGPIEEENLPEFRIMAIFGSDVFQLGHGESLAESLLVLAQGVFVILVLGETVLENEDNFFLGIGDLTNHPGG